MIRKLLLFGKLKKKYSNLENNELESNFYYLENNTFVDVTTILQRIII